MSSGAAGTRRYMAPEWKSYNDKDEKLAKEAKLSLDLEKLKTFDIYALGIILSDLVCNPQTAMETMRIDDKLK